ncbi:MAG: diguanylate cyclase (GGDEF)-like protein [Flavobacteriales bacterium]|jgi:diguanylate cyclase (GGDEF)-like protein
MRVLIVDDDQVDRQIIKRALRIGSVNYQVSEAETVDDGVAMLAKEKFDLILLDFRMPGRDGIELLLYIQDSLPEKLTAIVMMSNSEDEAVALQGIESGAQDFLLKSEITPTRLHRAILQAHTRFDLEQRLHESYKKVKQLAERDSLTGLANRYLFDESLRLTVNNNRRTKIKIALLLIDLDHFKYVNDNYGHDVGDLLLKRVVQRIHSCLRGHELFARLGGDEFAITLGQINRVENASAVAQRILRVMEKPFDINGRSISSGASIGISIFPDNGTHPEELFKFADIAMYRAKKMGRNQACFFEDEMQTQFISRFKIEQEIKKGIYDEQFFLLYQPIFKSENTEHIGFEALLYWKDDDGEIRSPAEFIPVAEESRMIIELGRWVISESLRQLSKWSVDHKKDYTLGINLSAVQLSDDQLLPHLKAEISKFNLSPSRVIIELTETALLNVTDETINAIDAIHQLGCPIALDDFGTGFSSISHLREFPIDIVKIDRSIVPTEQSNKKQRALFSCLVDMILSMEMDVVAEGVETIDQLELCIEKNVTHLQGYYFDRPLTVADVQLKYF